LKRSIAFFDFDGTITTKDTLLEFIRFSKGTFLFYLGFLLNAHYLAAYKLKIISNQTAKQKILRFFFGKMPLNEFEKICDDFAKHKIPALIRPKAIREIKKLKSLEVEVVIVSASPENWIQQWVNQMQLKLIATRLEVKRDRITGKINGRNCHGREKVNRIRELYTLSDYDTIYAYGDSGADRYMMDLATISFFKPFL
jgi:HAD superfamily hydrolase (TIGR01490 family)